MAVTRKRNVVTEMDQEQLYTTACLDLEIVKLFSDVQSKIQLYKRAIELLTKITTDFKEDVLLYPGETARDGRELTEEEKNLKAVPVAKKRLAEVRREYDRILSEYLEQDFHDAMQKFEKAETVAEFEEVITQLENNRHMRKVYLPTRSTLTVQHWQKLIEDQKSIAGTVSTCKEKIVQVNRKSKNKKKVWIALIALLIGAFLFTFTTPAPKLAKAKIAEARGKTAKERDIYQELYTEYGKPEYHEKYLELVCKRTKEVLETGDYKKAYDMIKEAVDEQVEGADEIMYQVELASIKNRNLGGSAHFGTRIWHILERTDDEAILTTRIPVPTDIPFSENGSTWEESDLRAYLNSEFYETTFTEIEKADILLSTVPAEGNAEYDIPAGNDTEDYVYILSADEVVKYGKFTKKHKYTYWLRNPGGEKGCTAFAIRKQPMMYGYLSNDQTISVYPVIKVSLKNIE